MSPKKPSHSVEILLLFLFPGGCILSCALGGRERVFLSACQDLQGPERLG